MKKHFLMICCALGVQISAQQSRLTVNNYSTYDFHGQLMATPLGTCYPMIAIASPAVPDQLIVPASNSFYLPTYSDGVGAGISSFSVVTSPTNPAVPRVPSHPSLSPSGAISTNTDWRHTKFQMFFAGTNTPLSSGGTNVPETYFLGNMGDGTNSCFTGPSYISSVYGDAEWFNISSGGVKYTYIQIY
ncbi:hypothetical protein [Chryseobacterium echinoideorum]|uniref:hypothetical protein n=1 Tax=Chryseobacterium echinoideorum TaxID=1549648 RepID=UPI00118700D2|nr:hypothetical protein [Chryseobacterium echinoideorum]